MSSTELVEALWAAFDRFEFEAVGTLLHDDFVFEMPQSGERIRGRDSFIAMNRHYPGQWRITIHKLIASGTEIVTEIRATYGDQTATAVSFFTIEDGKIIHVREYWPDPFDAPAWRAQWVERI